MSSLDRRLARLEESANDRYAQRAVMLVSEHFSISQTTMLADAEALIDEWRRVGYDETVRRHAARLGVTVLDYEQERDAVWEWMRQQGIDVATPDELRAKYTGRA